MAESWEAVALVLHPHRVGGVGAEGGLVGVRRSSLRFARHR